MHNTHEEIKQMFAKNHIPTNVIEVISRKPGSLCMIYGGVIYITENVHPQKYNKLKLLRERSM